MKSNMSGIKKLAVSLAALWTAFIGLSLYWNHAEDTENMEKLLHTQAMTSFTQDVLFRKWGAGHGGVYVPITDTTTPNENLNHIEHRDIEMPSVGSLTLMNPAYMLRQMHEFSADRNHPKRHLTSLNPLREENAPALWEREALEAFERGEEEVGYIDDVDDKELYRFMRPLRVTQECLKCHEHQGYKIGDIRGGISVSVSMAPYLEVHDINVLRFTLAHIIFWVLGLIVIFTGYTHIRQRLIDRNNYERALSDNLNQMESLVQERTMALATTNENLQNIVWGVDEFISQIDEEGRFIFVNHKVDELLGLQPAECVGKKALDFVHPEDRERLNAWFNAVVGRKNHSSPSSCRVVSTEGKVSYLAFTVNCKERGDGKLIFNSIARDTTKQREIEMRYQNLFNQMLDGFASHVMIYDDDGKPVDYRFSDINPAFTKMTGLTREQVVGRSVRELIPNIEEHWIESYGKVVTTGESILFENYTEQFDKHFEVLAYRIGTDRFACIFRDITLRKKAQAEKTQLQKQMFQHQKMEAVGTLAGGIAHDFNNILSAIFGYAELAKEDSTGIIESNIDEVLTAAERASKLVGQILAFSRENDEELHPVEIKLVVNEAAKLLRATLPSTIEIELELESGALISIDPTQLHQVIMNLATNASHAMKSTGGTLGLGLREVDLDEQSVPTHAEIGPGRYIELSVSDTGTGIAEDVQQRIFDPFFTTKKQGEGTGLGLSVVHGIVTNNKGSLTVESELGKGSTLSVLFPLSVDEQWQEKVEEEEHDLRGSERIMVVDDEPFMVKLVCKALERLGYETLPFEQSLDALEHLERDPEGIDLMLTDMTMPKITGDLLAVRAMEFRPDLPVILYTGYSDKITPERARELGIKEMVYKPISGRELATIIREVIDKR